MALTIVQRPKGLIFGNAVTATIDNNGGGGQFRIISTTHGLVTGDVVYVSSDISAYNGYWIVQLDGVNTFFITPYVGGDRVEYISGTSVDYYSGTTHGWSCAHLPIVYRLSNTKWPTNAEDTTRTILTLSNDLGYARVTISGTLGTFEDLSFVKISGASNSDFNGVYQILDKISTTDITLNVSYGTFNGSGLLGASIQLYYGNYNTVVRVYAGINSAHQWTAQKPYELAATLELIPDTNNVVFFSINEIIKAYIETKNDLLLGTLPNNIDAWCNFYIEYGEQYDSSNGYTVGTTLSSFTSDLSTFEGTAVNAMLLFKNIHSGYLSEYLMTSSAAKFLTLFTIPVLFSCGDDTPDCYNDISFIVPNGWIAYSLQQEFYSNGILITTDTDRTPDSYGVIRMPIEANCTYDRVDLTVLGGMQILDEPFFDATGDWLQTNTTTAEAPWTISGGMASVQLGPTVLFGPLESEFLYQTVSGTAGNYKIKGSLSTITGAGTPDWQVSVYVTFYTGGIAGSVVKDQLIGTLLGFDVGDVPTIDYDAVVNVPGSFDTISLWVGIQALPVNGNVTVQALSLEVSALDDELSETKQFDIDCGCADQEIRLTWLNYLGGFDYWAFKAETGKAIDITQTSETNKNIFPEWPQSYGEFSDTIRKQVSRESTNRLFFTSQYLTTDQADAVAYIKTSPLVQIINSKADRRTIIVDSDSFTKYTDNQKLITISFSARYTDNIGSQKV